MFLMLFHRFSTLIRTTFQCRYWRTSLYVEQRPVSCCFKHCKTLHCVLCPVFDCSFGGVDTLKIEEMEKMLKEAQLEKARLIESRVRAQLQKREFIERKSLIILNPYLETDESPGRAAVNSRGPTWRRGGNFIFSFIFIDLHIKYLHLFVLWCTSFDWNNRLIMS